MDILKEINEQFENSIIVTDVDSIRCLSPSMRKSQRANRSCPVVLWNNGLWSSRRHHRAKSEIPTDLSSLSPVTAVCRWTFRACNCSSGRTSCYPGASWQQWIPWNGTPVAEAFLRQTLCYGPICAQEHFPPHWRHGISSTPDFIKTCRELQGKKWIRVTKKEKLQQPSRKQKEHKGTYSNWIHHWPWGKWFILWSNQAELWKIWLWTVDQRKLWIKEWKRWISLCWEPGVLSKISGLFSGKAQSGQSYCRTTEDPTVSRMTIATVSDDELWADQNSWTVWRVIKVIDFTDVFVRMKEILYIKVLTVPKKIRLNCFRLPNLQGKGHWLWQRQPAPGICPDSNQEWR